MTYTVSFTDPNKTPITVTTGTINQTTSVSLVGKNVNNYGQEIAKNFIKLLENFTYKTAPNTPIEGQLWYDVSKPEDKTLKVYDGAVWRSTANISRGTSDPNVIGHPSKNGDLWVDTAQLKLKMFRNGTWTPVGFDPNTTDKTGSYSESIEAENGTLYTVIKTFIAGECISILSQDTFKPLVLINGFSTLRPGLNITTKTFGGVQARLSGYADASLGLKISSQEAPISADNFLRSDTAGTIDGFLNVNSNAGVRIGAFNQTFLLEKQINDGVILNKYTGGSIRIRTWKNEVWNELLSADGNNLRVGIKKQLPTADLDVGGNVNFDGTLNIVSTNVASIYTNGGIVALKDGRFGQSLLVTTTSTLKEKVTVGTTTGLGTIIEPARANYYDIGSETNPFRALYVNKISSTSTQFALVATGMILPYSGAVTPDGWLECNGAEVSGTAYKNLKDLIGTVYGAPVNPANVVLPDLRTKYLVTDTSGVTLKYYIKF